MMGELCVDCKGSYGGHGSRCPTCYVKFALKRKVKIETIRRVLEGMRREKGFDISMAMKILEKVE